MEDSKDVLQRIDDSVKEIGHEQRKRVVERRERQLRRDSNQRFEAAWAKVWCGSQEDVEAWEQACRELGTLLIDRYWDFWLAELESEAQAWPRPLPRMAVQLLVAACDPSTPKGYLADAMRRIGTWSGDLGYRFEEIHAKLQRMEEEQEVPWTPRMQKTELAKAMALHERTIHRRFELGTWQEQDGRYRSRDLEEQRRILRRIRDSVRRELDTSQ